MNILEFIKNIISHPKDPLDKPVLDWGNGNLWTRRHSFEGTIVFGATGTGKTSGTGKHIFSSLLKSGYGGLVLCVKDDEYEHWQMMARETERGNDLVVFGTNYGHCFNPFDSMRDGQNVVDLILILSAMVTGTFSQKDDPFWQIQLQMLLRNAVDLCLASDGFIDLRKIYDIIQSYPVNKSDIENPRWQSASTCWKELQNAIGKAPSVNLEMCKEFFLVTMPNMPEKTRANIVQAVIGVLDSLLRDPLYALFCRKSTISPDNIIHGGKIIIINMPVLQDGLSGRLANMIWKFCFQKALRSQRDGVDVFIAADEAQHFLTPQDATFQTTARSTRCASVYLTQNLPNIFAELGEYKTKSLLGNLKTRIFHQNACVDTNRWASETIGERMVERTTKTITEHDSGRFLSPPVAHKTSNTSYVRELVVYPEAFTSLKTGKPEHNNTIEAYINKSGEKFKNGKPCFKYSERRE